MLNDYDIEFVKRFSKKYLDMDIDKQLLSHQNDYIHKYKFVELAMHPSELYEYRTILDINLYVRQDGSDEVSVDVVRLSVNFYMMILILQSFTIIYQCIVMIG